MANVTITVTVASAPATAVSVANAPGGAISFTGPVAAGFVLGAIAVDPVGWTGTIALSGADAADFTVAMDANGKPELVVGPSGLAVRTTPYQVQLTAAP